MNNLKSDVFLKELNDFYENIEKAHFEEIISKLEEITHYIQNKNLRLDDTIECYRLSKLILEICDKRLSNAKLKIEKIDTESSQQYKDSDFASPVE